MSENPEIPYKFAALARIADLRNPPLPIEDISPNEDRQIPDQGVLIAFKTPPEYLKWFASCIEVGADILWRDNMDTAQQIKDGWLMATEYPLPIDSLDSVSEIDRAARQLTTNVTNNNVQNLRNAYNQSGGSNTSIFPAAPSTMPNVPSSELDELCAAVYAFIAYSLDELADAVSDLLDAPRSVSRLGKALGLKGIVASVLIKVGAELLETIAELAINNQSNLDTLSCIMLASLRGNGLNAGNFGRSLDVAPLTDPIQEAVRAVLSVNIKQIDAFIAFLDVYRQADTTPFAALPDCPCNIGWSYVFDFTQNNGGFEAVNSAGFFATYAPNVGWRSATGTGGQLNDELMIVRRTFNSTVIRQVRVIYAAPTAGGGGTRQLGVGGTAINLPQGATPSGDASINTNAAVTTITVALDTNVTPPASAGKNLITSIIVSGEGVNPFV